MTVLSPLQIAQAAVAAGFRGQGVVQAVAHVLAESGGDSTAVSPTHDYGWFQWNQHYHPEGVAVIGTQAEFTLAYKVTNGGTNWSQWSTTGNGQAAAKMGVATLAAAQATTGIAAPSAGGTGVQTVGLLGDVGSAVTGDVGSAITSGLQSFAEKLFLVAVKVALVVTGAGLAVVGVAQTARKS